MSVFIENETNQELPDKYCIIVEDIIDTGCTLKFLTDILCRTHGPKNLKVVTLLNKKIARKTDIEPDYYCFEVDDKFLIGYGLDYDGYYRNLRYIGYIDKTDLE